jgi:hypothetical protein
VAKLNALECLHDRRHLLHGVHRALEPSDVAGDAVGVDRHVYDAGVDRDEVVGAEGLGDHGGVGAQPALHQVVRAFAALSLAGDARDDQITREAHARAANGLGGHDDAGEAALHVLHAVPVQAIALETRRPRIAPPAAGERVDVRVAVQHEAGAAAGPAQGGDGLHAPGFDLLQVHGVVALAEELLEKPRDLGLLGLEARNADQRAGQVDELSRVDTGQDRARLIVHHRAGQTNVSGST